MITTALSRNPRDEWLARLRSIGIGLAARGGVGLGGARLRADHESSARWAGRGATLNGLQRLGYAQDDN